MLRKIVYVRRGEDEGWVDGIIRSTHEARERAKQCGIRFWVSAHLQAKWTWAGKIAIMPSVRLAKRATEWRDSEWWCKEQLLPHRLRARRFGRTRWFRWEDDLKNYAQHAGWAKWKKAA
eukprot:10618120-Karenia_brevis.AAC.1